jgi:glycopeptide antibiotics resistance protein
MRTLRWALLIYVVLLCVSVSLPLGPPRAPWKRHWLADDKPAHLTAFAQDVIVNVTLFLPLGFMGRLVLGSGASAIVLAVAGCALFSLGIETAQHFLMPWRYSTWIDVVSNTTGGWIGTGLAGVILLLDGGVSQDIDLGVGHR